METTKKIIAWNGVEIGLSTLRGERRFPMSPALKCDYGHVRGTWGQAKDGKSLDVYLVGPSPTVHKIYQINPQTKLLDEHKYVLGAESIQQAKEIYEHHVSPAFFGGIIEYDITRLKQDGGLTN